jgi:hypothetical protein
METENSLSTEYQNEIFPNKSAQLDCLNVEPDNMNHNIMDVYLKKHKLDLKIIPTRNMIKLSDLKSRFQLSADFSNLTTSNTMIQLESFTTTTPTASSSSQPSPNNSSSIDDLSSIEISNKAMLSTSVESTEFEDEDGSSSSESADDQESSTMLGKKIRKKREPSLKLQQKLNNQDLELIVNCVKAKQANVSIADVKKDEYVDKILKVKIMDDSLTLKLSNGSKEALLKKSMFPKELTTLFDAFVSSLCGQDSFVDERRSIKPILKCLVEACEFRSLSEAEMIRHIKR